MKTYLCITPVFLTGLINLAWAEGQSIAELKVNVDHVASEKGQILINLYSSKAGFPSDPEKALQKIVIPATEKEGIFEIDKLGEYAVAVCHDENSNSECDANFLGIPKEGYGVSQNAKGMMGPPKFEDAKINLRAGDNAATITLSY